MQFNDFSHAHGVLQRAVAQGEIPGAVAAVGVGNETLWRTAIGRADTTPGREAPMQLDTLFDLASLTKVTATLPSVLSLVEEGQVHLRTPVSTFFPEWEVDPKRTITLHQLLTHTAGLISHRPFYQTSRGYDAILEAVLAEALAASPGETVTYSDLGFILLGHLVQRITGRSLDAYALERVFAPLGMNDTRYAPHGGFTGNVAATERGADGVAKKGVVHDENAEAMGGISGHAGLFSTLSDMESYVKAWVSPEHRWLSPATRSAAQRLWTKGLGGHRGLGFVLREDPYDCAGDLWPLSTASHTGFTGTSIVLDPVSQSWAVLLTNAVHFGRTLNMVRIRRLFHNAIAAALF